MKTFCEIYVKNVLPAIRALLAKELVNSYSKSQMEVARVLDITQASINYYLYGKRASKITQALEKIPEIKSTVKKLASKVAQNENPNIGEFLCEFCLIIRSNREHLGRVLRAIGVNIDKVYVPTVKKLECL